MIEKLPGPFLLILNVLHRMSTEICRGIGCRLLQANEERKSKAIAAATVSSGFCLDDSLPRSRDQARGGNHVRHINNARRPRRAAGVMSVLAVQSISGRAHRIEELADLELQAIRVIG